MFLDKEHYRVMNFQKTKKIPLNDEWIDVDSNIKFFEPRLVILEKNRLFDMVRLDGKCFYEIK